MYMLVEMIELNGVWYHCQWNLFRKYAYV